MRPLTRPPFDPAWSGVHAAEVALAGLGDYCALCERRLPQGAIAWNAAEGTATTAPASRSAWPDLLALCPQCAESTAEPEARAAHATRLPLRPDRDATFGLGDGAPLAYRREPLRIAGEDGSEEVVERVVAVAGDERAAATIRAFALNSPVHADGALLLPSPASLPVLDFEDPRLLLRTQAWDAAHDAATRLQECPDELREILEQQTRILATVFGFWSVWATVLWERLGDRDLLARLLLPPDGAGRGADGAARAAGAAAPGPLAAYRATRDDWLPDGRPETEGG